MILPDFRVAKDRRLGECPAAEISPYPELVKDFP